MADRKWFGKDDTPEVKPPRALIAAASQVTISSKGRANVPMRTEAWQELAFLNYERLGEAWYAVNYLANMSSKVRLFIAKKDRLDALPEPVEDDKYNEALGPLHAVMGGLPEAIKMLSINMQVAGECYIVGLKKENDWSIRSVDEIRPNPSGEMILREWPGQQTGRVLTPSDFIMRVWNQHPRWKMLADSSFRSVLSVCDELILLEKAARAIIRSRPGSAGLLLIPSELSFGNTDPTTDMAGDGQEMDDPFHAELMNAMIEPLHDEDTASSIVPVVVRGEADMLKEIRHVPLLRPFDAMIDTRTERALRRLAQGLNVPPAVVTGLEKANHWCLVDQAEILTPSGWKTHDQISIGDLALTLNHETGMSEWQAIENINRVDVVNEPMISMESQCHSSVSTPNHRWPVLDGKGNRIFKTTETLTNKDRLITGAPCADIPTESKWTDDFIELMGWHWTEGSEDQNRISIPQSHTRNPERVARIRNALTKLYGPGITDRRLSYGSPAEWREKIQPNDDSYGGPITVFYLNKEASEPFIANAPNKRVSLDFIRSLTRAQLLLFIEISCQGDGRHYRSGRLDIWQSESDMLDAYELATILSGYMVTRTEDTDGYQLNPWKRQKTFNPISSGNSKSQLSWVKEQIYSGKIWCPVTKNSTWLTRMNGKVCYTGNSAFIIDEDTFKGHIEPQILIIIDAITKGILYPYLTTQLGMSPAEASLYTVWYDPTPLLYRPNKAQDAREVHKAFALSDEALRKANLFTEDDAPSDEERAVRMAAARGAVESPMMNLLYLLEAPDLLDKLKALRKEEPPTFDPLVKKDTVTEKKDLTPPPTEEPPKPPKGKTPKPARKPGAIPDTKPSSSADGLQASAQTTRLATKLSDADMALTRNLYETANTVFERAIEKIGARIISKARKDAGLKETLAAVPTREVAAILGPTIVESLTVQEEATLEEAAAEVVEKFVAQATYTQNYCTTTIPDVPSFAQDNARMEFRQALDDAKARLAQGLVEFGNARLYSPNSSASPQGEIPQLKGVIPYGFAREVVARAGGVHDLVPLYAIPLQPNLVAAVHDPSAMSSIDSAGPAGGVCTGTIARNLIGQSTSIEIVGYRWDYGSMPRSQEFEQHKSLDGTDLASWQDGVLANPQPWPVPGYFFPGDSENCTCGYSFILEEK